MNTAFIHTQRGIIFVVSAEFTPFHRKRVTPDYYGNNVHCLENFEPVGIPVRQAVGGGMPGCRDAVMQSTLQSYMLSRGNALHGLQPLPAASADLLLPLQRTIEVIRKLLGTGALVVHRSRAVIQKAPPVPRLPATSCLPLLPIVSSARPVPVTIW